MVAEQKMAQPCILALVKTQFEDRTEEHHWECEIDALDNDGIGGKFVELNLNFDLDYNDPAVGLLEPGVTTLQADDVILAGSKAIVRGQPKFSKKPKKSQSHRRHLEMTGTRTVLVVRVIANGVSPTLSSEDLARSVFGTADSDGNTNDFNLASGFAQCSYNQLLFEPTPNDIAENGVYTVSIDETAEGASAASIRNAALEQLKDDLGTSDLNSLFDHVIFCLPPGKSKGENENGSTFPLIASIAESHNQYIHLIYSFSYRRWSSRLDSSWIR